MTIEFGPRLDVSKLYPVEITYLSEWGIDARSQVVTPQEPGLREFLLWHGQRDHDGQFPIFAVPVSTRQIIMPNNLLNWVYGIACQEVMDACPDRLGIMLDAATSPAETLRLALGQLACIAPPKNLAVYS